MKRPRNVACSLFTLLAVFASTIPSSVSANLEVLSCLRELDLTTQLVLEGIRLTMIAVSPEGGADQIFVGVPSELVPHLSFYEAHQIMKENDAVPIGMAPADVASASGVEQPPDDIVLFAIRLAKPIKYQDGNDGEDPAAIEIKFVYNGAMTPLPSEIEQLEDQKMLLQHSLLTILPYPVRLEHHFMINVTF